MELKDYLTLIWILCSSIAVDSLADDVSVKLVEGQSPNQGKVMVRLAGKGAWKPLCAKHFGDREAAVLCRQLGFSYSLNEPDVYTPQIPDWVSEDIRCHGNETNIGQCFHGNHDCFHQTDSYAAVCCSSSSEFGERHVDGLYISHCAKPWMTGMSECTKLGLKLAELHISHFGSIDNTSGPVWNGKFLTPWIWLEDCVEFTTNMAFKETDIPNNSPEVCFQICGQTPGTLFVLSGTLCRCLPNKGQIRAVKPHQCSSVCPGNSDRYCGDSKQLHWDLYKIGSKDDDFAVYSTQPNDTRQCAGLIQNTNNKHRLRSQPCHSAYGYICSEFKSVSTRGYIPLRAPKLTLSMARQTCRNKTEVWKLAGSDVINSKLFTNVQEGSWVDIESSLVPIYKSKYLDPDLCQTARIDQTDGLRLAYEMLDCRNNRLLYTCSSGAAFPFTTRPSTRQHDRTTSLQTVILDDDTTTSQQTTSVIRARVFDIELWQVIIAVLVGVLVASLLVIIFICWKKRKRRLSSRRQNSYCQENQGDSNYMQNLMSSPRRISGEYDVINDDNADSQPLNIYEELSTADCPDIYSQLDSPNNNLHQLDDNITAENGVAGRKESLKLKTSYSFPQDSVRDKNGVRRHDSVCSAIDPKYSYPYDCLEKLKIDPSKKNVIAEEIEND